MVKEKLVTGSVVTVVSVIVSWLYARMGILIYALLALTFMMVVDYFTGMLASKAEAIDHPEDPAYGWNSKKGAKGIIKKVGYLCIISVAIVADYIILWTASDLGFNVENKTFFALLVTIWYLLNELLSIIENAGRMGADVPDWLAKYIAILKKKIDSKGGN